MRYIEIREVPIPDIRIAVSRDRWTDEERETGQCSRTEPMKLNVGAILLEMAVRPVAMGQGGPQAAGNDYQTQRKARNLIKALDANRDGVCDVPNGEWVGLEDAWYEMLMEQAKIWPWNFRAPEIADMIESWENAPTEKPLTLKEPTSNGQVEYEAEAVPA